MLKLGVSSLDEVPEVLRGICSVTDGAVSLDETAVRTEADVRKMADARDHEKSDHKATKAKLAAWGELGMGVEDVRKILDEYPTLKEGTKTNADYLEEKRQHFETKRALEALQREKSELDARMADLLAVKEKAQKEQAWKDLRAELAKTYDVEKLDTVFEDNADKISLDDIGQFQPFKGKSVREFMETRAKVMGWELKNTPGASSPGAHIPKNLPAQPVPPVTGNILDDDIASILDK